MKFKVILWDRDRDYHVVSDVKTGDKMLVDLMVSGDLGGIDPASLVGKVVEWDRTHAYISIAHGVKIAEAQP